VAEAVVATAWVVVLAYNVLLALRGVARPLGPVRWLGGFAAVAVALASGAALERLSGGPRALPPSAAAVGVACVMLGATLHVWARRAIGAAWAAAADPADLVEVGPYRIVRHPLYLGLAAMAIGTVLVRPSLATLAGGIGFAASLVLKIAAEERALARAFGARWDDYRARVPCFVPRIRPG
jgi:protein-S-isoprenylcysteine O-methyltransferase Ste14